MLSEFTYKGWSIYDPLRRPLLTNMCFKVIYFEQILNLTTLLENSADDTVKIFFLFFPENRL